MHENIIDVLDFPKTTESAQFIKELFEKMAPGF